MSQTLACEEALPAAPLRSRRGTSIGALSNQDVRARVVQEILNTEKDYVKNLKDVVEVSHVAFILVLVVNYSV